MSFKITNKIPCKKQKVKTKKVQPLLNCKKNETSWLYNFVNFIQDKLIALGFVNHWQLISGEN